MARLREPNKWLCTPLGAGILQIRKDKIASVWPLLGDTTRADDDIRKFERILARSWNALPPRELISTNSKRARSIEVGFRRSP